MTIIGVWGPKLWHSLHCTALNYPENPSESDKQNYKSFYLNVHRIIPCNLCANHYRQNVIAFDLDLFLTTPMDLFRFTVDIHNLVNKQLGKPLFAFEDALSIHQPSCGQCPRTSYDGLQDLIDGLQPQSPDSQKNDYDSLISVLLETALSRFGMFSLGIAVTVIGLQLKSICCTETKRRKMD